jgi:hypothetical protein
MGPGTVIYKWYSAPCCEGGPEYLNQRQSPHFETYGTGVSQVNMLPFAGFILINS